MATQQLPFPDQIAHSPVYALAYNAHDPGNEGDTDAQWLSIGWSQWDENELAAKVVRYSGKRWSRQSEEVPVARLVDLTTLLAMAFMHNAGEIDVEPNFFENQPVGMKIKAKKSSARDLLATAMHRDPKLRRRMSKLADVMVQLRNDRQV
jgi:hypothetical protein